MSGSDTPSDTLTDSDLLVWLSEAGKPMTLREISSIRGLRHGGRRALAKAAGRLKKQGAIEELGGGRFRPSAKGRLDGRPHSAAPLPKRQQISQRDTNAVSGRFVAHRDGYGFVVPDTPRPDFEGDLFIPPARVGDAMHGDRVIARVERRGAGRVRGAPSAARAEGAILQVLERAHATVVGLFRRRRGGNFVEPYESRITQEIVIPPGRELPPSPQVRGAADLDGAVVDVEITRFPGLGVPPAGRVIEVLGRPGDFGVDVEILIRKYHLPHRFETDVLADAHRVAHPVAAAERDARRDFRDLPIVTIDGETARDFDDAVYVERLPHGWRLQVHIADVAHYVQTAAPLDREARLRGTSVYFPDRAVPMLPEELSNGICSLNPREERLVMSALLEFDETGEVTSADFASGVIRSAERMTYTDVNRVLEGDADAIARYAPLVEHFRAMRDLALILNARRARRGSLDFDLPEPVLTFDAQGQMTGVVRSERNIAHRLIEEFMLAANQAVAHYLESRGIASLHRVHEKPDPKKVLEFEELAHAFGYSLGVPGLSERRIAVRHGRVPAPGRTGRGAGSRQRPMVVSLPGAHEFQIQPQHYQRLTQKIAGKPEERIVSYLMLRSLKQARYAAELLGHFALAFDEYTHFTSPIRRYPDLIVHRVLKWALAHPQGVSGEHGPYELPNLTSIALESSEAERRADAAERELMDWKRAQFMEQHLGEEYDALVISVQKFGFFVELIELFVEGLVPINRLEEETGDPCFYRERDHAIVSGRGPHQRIWRLGDRLRVRADRIDPIRRRVEFALVPAKS